MTGGIGDGKRDMEEGGSIKFDGWDGLNEYELLAVKAFEEGVENTIVSDPPCLHIGGDGNDVVLFLCLAEGLGRPCWKFSLKEILTDLGWDDEDKADLADGLTMLAAFVSSQITKANGGGGDR
jgi:hypothetical protein